MRCQGLARSSRRYFGSIKKAGQNNGASALHVIVKHWITMTEGVQVVEGMFGREVLHIIYEEDEEPGMQLFSHLELDEELGECTGHCKHELLHKFSHGFI